MYINQSIHPSFYLLTYVLYITIFSPALRTGTVSYTVGSTEYTVYSDRRIEFRLQTLNWKIWKIKIYTNSIFSYNIS